MRPADAATWGGGTGLWLSGTWTGGSPADLAIINSGEAQIGDTVYFTQPTLTISASEDALVCSDAPSTNYGHSQFFGGFLGDSASGTSVSNGYVKFNTYTIPTGSIITDATLSLKLYSACYSYPPSSFDTCSVNATSSNWSESTITWANQPGTGIGGESDLAYPTWRAVGISRVLAGAYKMLWTPIRRSPSALGCRE